MNHPLVNVKKSSKLFTQNIPPKMLDRLLNTTMKYRSSRPEVFCEKGVLRNFTKFTGKHQKDTLAQVFSCDFCEISQNAFFTQNTSGGCFQKYTNDKY